MSKKELPLWLFVAGIYRSGSTTQYEMTRDIVEKTNVGIGIGYHTESKLKEFDASNNRIVVCKVFEPLFDGFQGKPSYAKKIFDENRASAIVTIRDPRDIITSMKKREEGRNKKGNSEPWSFKKTALENFPVWLKRLDSWIEHGAMVTRYEDMITDLHGECKRIASHVGIEADDKLLKSIANNYSISSINKRKQKDKGMLPSRPAIVFGTSGTNKTWLTDNERAMIESQESAGRFMEKYGYRY